MDFSLFFLSIFVLDVNYVYLYFDFIQNNYNNSFYHQNLFVVRFHFITIPNIQIQTFIKLMVVIVILLKEQDSPLHINSLTRMKNSALARSVCFRSVLRRFLNKCRFLTAFFCHILFFRDKFMRLRI